VFWNCRNPHCIRYSDDYRRMNAWKPMTWNSEAETDDIIRLRKREENS